MLDKSKFINLMTGLCDLYNKTPSEFIYDAYYDAVKIYDYRSVEAAVKKVIATHKYNCLPKPADILEFLEGNKDDKALVAWLQVKEAIKKGGYYSSIEFADHIISNCIAELGGWQWLCSQTKEDMVFIENRFMDMYRLFLKRGISGPVRLVGFFESKNYETGHNEQTDHVLRVGFSEDKLECKKEDNKIGALVKK